MELGVYRPRVGKILSLFMIIKNVIILLLGNLRLTDTNQLLTYVRGLILLLSYSNLYCY